MSFEKPTSEVYLLNVPFDITHKNVIDFSSRSAQFDAFKSYMNGKDYKHFTKCNIIRKENILYLRMKFGSSGTINDAYKYNYMIFKNPELDNKWWYCFVYDINYHAEEVIAINFRVDVWQTFQFDITYRKCMVERAHISRDKDSFKYWNEPEPLTVLPYGESQDLNIANNNLWHMRFIVLSQTVPSGGTEEGGKPIFWYGGSGRYESVTNEDSTPLFALALDSRSSGNWGGAYDTLLNTYNKAFADHRSDIIGLQALPSWAYSGLTIGQAYGGESGFHGIQNNNEITRSVGSFTANSNIIAPTEVNYAPRNKKILSSLCRTFVVYNKSGFTLYIKPEDIYGSANTVNFSATLKPINVNNIKIETSNLRQKSTAFWYIPYNAFISLSYNENEGAVQNMRKLQAGLNFALSVGSTAAAIYTGGASAAVSNAGIAQAFNTSLESGVGSNNLGLQRSIATRDVVRGKNAENIVSGGQDIFNSGLSLYKACVESNTAGNSNSGDWLQFTGENMHLQIREIYASEEQLRECDDFLDVYGYARNEIMLLSNVLNNRSNWNYVKTVNCNIQVKSTYNYELELQNMFNNGVTIWHSFAKFESGYNTADNDDKNQ